MKHIVKGAEPDEFAVWKSQACADWQPTWDGLQNPPKTKLREALITEQGNLCCYCQVQITDNSDSHIEHFKPRSCPAAEDLNYNNLHASCNNPQHCGRKKDDWYDPELMISPLDSDCEAQFSYTSNGEILAVKKANKQKAAEAMISKLNLNCDGLIRRRRAAIDGVVSVIEALSREEIDEFVRGYSERNRVGKFTPFCMAIVDVLRKYQ